LLLWSSVQAFSPLQNVKVAPIQDTSSTVDIGGWLNSGERCLMVFGSYAADFNAIEYGQRLRYYWPILKNEKNLQKCGLVLNCQKDAALQFGVERGWLPDNNDVNPFLKLFGMLWGLGAWATLPAVIGGYLGNPFVAQPWIEDAMAVGNRQGRWPDAALEMNCDKMVVVKNKFDDLPLVGSWPRRPLELATLRLQSMLGISLANWNEMSPDEEALKAGVLTQLGGCIIADKNGKTLFEWRDPGICAVANFEDILTTL
jgi:AhpC/TSA antioxidant enzyme